MNSFTKILNTPIIELELPEELLSCKPGTSLRKVLDAMKKLHVGSVIVLDDQGRAAGIITERDFLFKVCGSAVDFKNSTIDEFMTPHPTTVELSSTLEQVMQCMSLGGFRHVVIVDENSVVVSVISIKDVLGFFYEKLNVDEITQDELDAILPDLPLK